jgi:hypothetical protein
VPFMSAPYDSSEFQFEGQRHLSVKRILIGASFIGAVSLPTPWLAAGVAAADPAPEPAVSAAGEPLPPDSATQSQQGAERAPAPKGDAGSSFELPPGLSEQLNQAAASLPSPVSLNVPVSVGLPGIGLPGIGLSVPLVLGSLPPPPQLPQIGPPQLPGIGIPQLPF